MSCVRDFIEEVRDQDLKHPERGPLHFTSTTPPAAEVIEAREAELGLRMPESFKEFYRLYGDARFFDVKLFAPEEWYRLPETAWEMEGFIPFTYDGFGNQLAFKPIPGAVEFPVYKCSFDPIGSGFVAENFAHWLREHFSFLAALDGGEPDPNHVYYRVEMKICESNDRYKAAAHHPVWQFWRNPGFIEAMSSIRIFTRR